MSKKFEQLSLTQELLSTLEELKFTAMTPIQEQGLPFILDGKDIIAQAKTGSGKTATFGLGILNSLNVASSNIQAIILCPTRELAEQVATEIRRLARKMKNVKVLTICGGAAEVHQEKSLAYGAHIVVGTPGRVLRLLKKDSLNLKMIKTFVLDEADRMLDMGFNEDIMEIASHLPSKRQSLLFSATFQNDIKELGASLQNDAIKVKVDVDHMPNVIDQLFYAVDGHKDKEEALLKVLGKYRPNRLIVFCKTKQITDDVAKFLNRHGIFAAAIHGDLLQNDRTAVLTQFSNRSLSVLVATDVAARGLDIIELEAVINYDLPEVPEIYIHRIGRTGRAGKNGLAFSFFLQRDLSRLSSIEELTHQKCIFEDLALLSTELQYNLTPSMKTMYIGGGKKNNLRPGDILGALVGEAKLDPADVGDITILNILSYVAIKKESINLAINRLRDGKIKNRKFKVGLA